MLDLELMFEEPHEINFEVVLNVLVSMLMHWAIRGVWNCQLWQKLQTCSLEITAKLVTGL